ncbi:hypothetical protein [Floridanema aerugineum]|uniref:Effector-associated domain-containing protein n=1 Tax=Floridaenema aerugineum BLCC-F46 TaxID=3153654 RepID=A0ABV4XF85_9CYAN
MGNPETFPTLFGKISYLCQNQGFGDKSIKRIRQLVEALLDYALNDSDRISRLHASWKDNSTHLSVTATLEALRHLLRDKDGFKPTEKTSDKQTRLYIGEVLPMFEELQIQKSIAETNYDLAQLYRQRNNTELAQQHYNTAHQIFQQLGAAKDIEKIEREWEHN